MLASAQYENLVRAKVTSVFDGDGCRVVFPDRAQTVEIRFLGIDAPERKGYSQKAQPYGNAAGDTLRALIKGKDVLLDTSATSGKSRDAYGRVLADVYLEDSTSVQFYMVSRGLAWYLPVKNRKHPKVNAVLRVAMEEAKVAKKGLWGSYLTPDGKVGRIFLPSTWRKRYSIR